MIVSLTHLFLRYHSTCSPTQLLNYSTPLNSLNYSTIFIPAFPMSYQLTAMS